MVKIDLTRKQISYILDFLECVYEDDREDKYLKNIIDTIYEAIR